MYDCGLIFLQIFVRSMNCIKVELNNYCSVILERSFERWFEPIILVNLKQYSRAIVDNYSWANEWIDWSIAQLINFPAAILVWLLTCTVNHDWFVNLRHLFVTKGSPRMCLFWTFRINLVCLVFRGGIWTICFRGFAFVHLLSQWTICFPDFVPFPTPNSGAFSETEQ